MGKKINYAKMDGLEKSDFSVEKIRITTFVDADIIDWIKENASKKKMRYQTYLNHILRELKDGHIDQISEFEKRLSKLEKKLKTA